MTFDLYHTAGSTCSQKVRLTLAEKGFPERNKDWIEHNIDLGKNEQLDPEYMKLNPNGVIPTLVHDGQAMYESSAIMEYLNEVFPEPAMMPEDAALRARARAWMRYIDEVPTTAVRIPSFANLIAPMRYAKQSNEEFAAHADRLPLRKQFYKSMTQKGFGKEEIDHACGQIRQTCERIEKSLDELGGAWILGDRYTLVDAQVTPMIDRMDDLGYDSIWYGLKLMNEWWDRIKARPSYKAAFYSGSRLSERFPEYFKTAQQLKEERGY